jgi:formylglycine-generating enzyme required for sulfatase activity
MIVVPAGSFMMGSQQEEKEREDGEGPQHLVTIARPFAIGKFEVTFAEWDACVGERGCRRRPGDQGWGRGKRPVINVSWETISKEYLPWLSRKTGKEYRLPTEAEWEYAARAGTTTPFWTGASISTSQANFFGDKNRMKTVPVDSFAGNPWGLYNVHGNVQEWVQDCDNPSYNGASSDGAARTSGECGVRTMRGGSWENDVWRVRTAIRRSSVSNLQASFLGFRVARSF